MKLQIDKSKRAGGLGHHNVTFMVHRLAKGIQDEPSCEVVEEKME
jgi:hypothetical protein